MLKIYGFLRGLHSLSIINTNGYMHSVLLDKKNKLRPVLSNEFYFGWAVGESNKSSDCKSWYASNCEPIIIICFHFQLE